MTPNRIVAVLTPLVFAPLAGAVAAWLSQHFPGVDVSEGSLEEVFIAGALIALAPAAQWLHGWQKHEARQAELQRDVALATAAAPAAGGAVEAPQAEEETADALDELDKLEQSLLEEEDPSEAGS
jgi:hypothetical protein